MTVKYLINNLVLAAGPAGIAEKMSINVKTFRNKIDPNQDTHHLYVEELDSLVTALDTDEIARYFAEQRGMICIKKPNFEGISDQALTDLGLLIDEKRGEYSKEIRLSLFDGDASFDEAIEVKKKFDAMQVAIHEYQNKYIAFMALCEERRAARGQK
ncbi:phage regulatory CII family protein [Nitrosomonas supralitoralis]|uniref:Phage regulatory protein CII (CP76) n=1 Tax=Nitrosomonas supralitoralis TaxID=2116706 RepID=A0A2P7NSA9_9PROT|nr:phage regulatory CII family protein [Nitrosomonas supralitoralis]PSJ16352.1 hypothetical protein C7H79_13925 [Nitrosomonas supralitoralis]